MTPLKTLIEEEKKIYWEKVHDVQNEIDWGKEEDSPIHEFGLKTIRNDELFTVVDWKNIESHLISAMQRAYEAGHISWLRSEIEKLEKDLEINGSDVRIDAICKRLKDSLKSIEN